MSGGYFPNSGQQYPGQQYPGQQYPGPQYPGPQYPGPQAGGQSPAYSFSSLVPVRHWARDPALRSWPVLLLIALVCVPPIALVLLNNATESTIRDIAWIFAAYFAVAWLLLLGVIVRPQHVSRSMLAAIARDRRRKPDAILGVAHVVIHRLRDGDDLEALRVKARRIAQRVVAADRDQVIEPQRLHVLQHPAGHVVDHRRHALLGDFGLGELQALHHRRQGLHLGRVGAGTMQVGAARAVDRARVLAIERQNVARPARRIVQIDMRQALPAAANTDDFAIDLASSVNNGLDDGIQARHVSAAGEYTDPLRRH